jgi:hypothetical protein
MNRGPQPGKTKADHVATARAAWGPDVPDFVVALARKASEVGQKAAGGLVGYSGSTVSEVISNKYRGSIAPIEKMIRGALMGQTVDCPAVSIAIGVDRCRSQQKRPFSSSSPMAVRWSRACQTCKHREVKP